MADKKKTKKKAESKAAKPAAKAKARKASGGVSKKKASKPSSDAAAKPAARKAKGGAPLFEPGDNFLTDGQEKAVLPLAAEDDMAERFPVSSAHAEHTYSGVKEMPNSGRKIAFDDALELAPEEPKEDYLCFHAGGEGYALEASGVNEILRHQRITFVPRCAPHVIGATSLRGAMIPVLNLGTLIRGGSSEPPVDGRILVLSDSGIQIGVLVEKRIVIMSLGTEELLPPPAGESGEFAYGAVKVKGEFFTLLRAEAITRTRATGRLDERKA